MPGFHRMSLNKLRQVVYAMLREWVSDIAVANRGTFIDFNLAAATFLGIDLPYRVRLMSTAASQGDIDTLCAEASALGQTAILIAASGIQPGVLLPNALKVVGPAELKEMCLNSGVIIESSAADGFEVDRTSLAELSDAADTRISFMNGLLWLRPLSRNRIPPPLRGTGRPAHELFERCFFVTATTTFRAHGESWGTRKRGLPIPDGMLHFPGLSEPTLYDCKASRDGYAMTHRDLTGFVDYLKQPLVGKWAPPPGAVSRFLVVSSIFLPGTRTASFRGRQAALSQRVPGAKLTWIRSVDFVRFGLAIERADVAPTHREKIDWASILDAGETQWDTFEVELRRLKDLGYSFLELN